MIIIELIYNLSILVALSVLSGFINTRLSKLSFKGQAMQGFLFGATAIIGMLYPFVLTEGIIFDGRSIVISLCAFFFGPLSGLISAIMAIIFRSYLGGSGAMMGILVILSSFIVGYLFYNYRKKNPDIKLTAVSFYLFGLIVHALMMVFVLTLPSKNISQAFHTVTITIIGVYPLVTILIGKILLDQEQNITIINTLKEREKLFRTTLYSIGDGVITTDDKGLVVNMNNVAEKLTGWKESEAKRKPLEEIFVVVNEDTKLPIINPVDIFLKKGVVVGLANHTILISRDGINTPISDSGSPIRDEAGTIVGVVLVFSDQTEERLKEKKLVESTAKFSKIFNSSSDSISLTDLKSGKVVEVNLGFEKIFGYKREEIIGRSTTELGLWVDESERDRMFNIIKSGGSVNNFEAKGKRKNGEVLSALISGEIVKLSGQSYIFTTIREITDLVKTQASLKANEERFTSIINGLTDLIIIIDHSGLISYISPSVKNTLGYDESDMFGRDPMDFVYDLDKEIAGKELQLVAASKNSGIPTLYRANCKNGSVCYLETVGVNMFENRAVNGLVLISRDVTERLRANSLEKEYADLFEDLVIKNVDPILILSRDGSVLFANSACNKLVNLDEGINLIGMNFSMFMSADESNKAYEAIAEVLEFGGPIVSDYEIRTSRGDVKWISATGLRINYKSTNADLVTIRDITERKIIEESLRESEKNYKFLFQSNPQPMWVYDKHTLKFLAVNDYAISKYGYSEEEFLSMSLYDIRPEEEFEKLDANIFVSDQTIQESGYWKHKSKDGRVFFVEIFSHGINFMGKDARIVLANDVTERKRVEEIIRNSEETYRLTAEQTGQIVYDHNMINRETKWAGAIEQVTGYSYYEFISVIAKDIYQYVHPDDKDITLKTCKDSVAKGESYKVRYRFKHKTGIYIYLEDNAAFIKDDDNIPVRMLGTLTNVTERTLVENQLRNLSRTVEQSPVSIVITDIEGKIEYVNPKFEEVSGYSYKEVLGENPRILSSGTKTKIDYEQMWKTILSGKEWRGEFYNKKKNGELYWESATISPLYNEKNEILRFVAIKEDITQQKKMTEELILAKEKAEEMNKLKSYFFANMSHELRTPFVGILGFAEILKENLKDTSDEEFADQILKSSKRLTDTLNKILNLTRIEYDKVTVKPQSTNINKLLKDMDAFYSSSAKLKATHIVASLPDEDLVTFTDTKLLEDILNNLISNAVKFTNDGTINLSAEKIDVNKNHFIKIVVADTGIGIPEEKQQIVWEEFRQASEGLNRSFEGTGLGLSITKKYVALLDGEITLASKENEGTTFTIILPFRQVDTIMLDSSPDSTGIVDSNNQIKNKNKKAKILYVEDDHVALKFIELVLKSSYDIETVYKAKDALELVGVKQYDLLMLDINLGIGMDGIQLLQEIRKIDYYKNIPAIAVTAYAAESDKKEFLSKGFNQYISKPFTQADLHKLLDSVLKF